MPGPVNPPEKPGQKAAIGALIAAGVAVAAPLAMKWEGYSGKVYKDPVGIKTWCYGETEKKLSEDPMYIYSKAECAVFLRERMAADYAPKVLKCVPQLLDMPRDKARKVFGALIDASYNAGPRAVCRSPMVAYVKAGNLTLACSERIWSKWYVTAKGVPLRGLVNRRKDEARVCREALVA